MTIPVTAGIGSRTCAFSLPSAGHLPPAGPEPGRGNRNGLQHVGRPPAGRTPRRPKRWVAKGGGDFFHEHTQGFFAGSAAAATTLAATLGRGQAMAMGNTSTPATAGNPVDRGEDPRITRARLAGPAQVTRDATVAEMDQLGAMKILVKGTNDWICMPGDLDKIGDPPMCLNPMGLQWAMDARLHKPKPTNAMPGIIYMLCGATQRSNTNLWDKTSPAIPIGPHWMITWPFDPPGSGLPTTIRDAGAWVMFAGTPYAYLHICGSPWDGNEYDENSTANWSMTYRR